MPTTVLIARPLWPVLRRVAPFLTAAGYCIEETSSWSRLLDPQLPCLKLSGVLLGEHGNAAEEMHLIRRFRERDGTVGVPVVLVGGLSALLRADKFRAAGADEVISADIHPESLMEKIAPLLRYGSLYQSLLSANRALRDQAMLDDLTGLPNRRRFSMDLARNVEMARRIGRPLSCIIVDIDDFKKVNDAYGHPAGDDVIRQFGTMLSKAKRAYDTVARLGGDEFAWLLVDADRPQALQAAGRAHEIVKESVFVLDPGPVRVTATFGVSSVFPGVDLSAEYLVGNADRALYWGKESGKNVIRFYPVNKGNPNAAADTHLS
ncbi:MAG: GGDEF domain-containing protein [Deltaproteobacteria bacterium]|nr:GGDEF domain-containing protein [Deltaproteobacteria bacterium]